MAAPTGLNSEVVIEAASALVDRDGWQHLTMTDLARKLSVRGPSLYHHVGSIEALLADVQVRALADLSNRLARAAMGKVGPDCFRALAEQLSDYAVGHPGLYELSQSQAIDPTRALPASEPARAALIAVIESFGVTDPPLDLLLTCLAPLHGVLALDRSGAITGANQRTTVYRRATDLVIMLLEKEGKAT